MKNNSIKDWMNMMQINIISIKDCIDSIINEVVKEMRDGFDKQWKFNKEISILIMFFIILLWK